MRTKVAGGEFAFLFETNFAMKALLGLFGFDNLRVAVSRDCSAFNDASGIDADTHIVDLPGQSEFRPLH